MSANAKTPARLRELPQNPVTQMALWEWDIDSDRVSVGATGAALLGLPAMEAEVTARELLGLVHPADRGRFLRFQLEAARQPTSFLAMTLRMRTSNSQWRALQVLGRSIAPSPGERSLRVLGSVGPGDGALVTAPNEPVKKDSLDSLPTSIVRKLLAASAEWHWELDEALNLSTLTCRSATEIKLEQQLGQRLWTAPMLQVTADQEKLLQSITTAQRAIDGVRLKLQGGRELQLHGFPRFDAQGQFRGYIGVGKEIAHAEEAGRPPAIRETLHMLANQDLLNQRLERQIVRAQKTGHQFALVVIELERISALNASLGANAVNFVVLEAGQRILKCVRENDTLARIGRSEFLLLLTGLNRAEEAERAASEIVRSLTKPILLKEQHVSIGCSMGISIFPNDATEPELLIKRARLALFHAAERGQNQFEFFSAELVRRAALRMEIENDLHLALERSEFSLVYQPRISLHSGNITGVEALLRWNRRGKGLVPPSVFISMAEELSLMESIGAWALEQACLQLRRWHDQGLHQLKLAVNVSPVQLKDPKNFLSTVLNALSSAGLKGTFLEVEVTEAAVMTDLGSFSDALQELANMGVRIALDDFGTGYSSLACLRQLPIHILKLDRSFLAGIQNNPRNTHIVRSVIDLAHALNSQVVMEGVEGDNEIELLREYQCDEFLGNWFCPALPAAELTRRMLTPPPSQ